MQGKRLVGWLGIFLTFLKPIFTLGVIVLITYDHPGSASLSIFGLMVSDIFDGVLFRHSTLASNSKLSILRRAADIIGDRIAIDGVFLTMVHISNFPFYIYGIEITRQIIIAALVFYGWKNLRPIRNPNLPSRIATFCVGLMAIAWLTLHPALTFITLSLAGLFGTIGIYQYYKTIQNQKNTS